MLSFGHISFVAVGALRRACSRSRRARSRRSCRTSSRSSATTRSATSRRSRSPPPSAGSTRSSSALAADAALRPGGGYRDLRRARDHAQRPRATGRRSGPGLNDVLARPGDDRPLAGDDRRDRSRSCVAFAYQRSRFGRMLRATREDPAAARAVGISVYRQRLCRLHALRRARRLRGRPLRAPAADQRRSLYLDLTFITLAMLVVGGVRASGARSSARSPCSALDSFLAEAENGLHFGVTLDLPAARGSSSSAP